MKVAIKILQSILLIILILVLLESLYYITPEANQLTGNIDRNSIATIINLVCLVLLYKASKIIFDVSKLGAAILIPLVVIFLFAWPSYKCFPANTQITADKLYSLSLQNKINLSNSEIYIYNSGDGWVEVKKLKYNEIKLEENKQKRIVGIRLRNINYIDIIKLNSCGFYSIQILIPIKEL